MKKIIIVLLLICLNVFSFTNLQKISLDEFSSLLAKTYNINIVFNSDIDIKSSFYLRNDVDLLSAFKLAIQSKDYVLKKYKNIYFISKKKKNDILPINRVFNVSFLTKDDLDSLHKYYNFVFIPSKNVIIYKDFKKKLFSFTSVLNSLQKVDKQLTFKVTIFNTNLDKIKNIGLDFNSNLTFSHKDFSFFTSFLGLNTNVSYPTTLNSSFNIYSMISYLKKNNVVSILNQPFLLAKNLKKSSFEIVKTIPYRTSTVTSSDSSSSSKVTTSLKYKDIGLKLSLTPKIYNDSIDVDFSLTLEDLSSMTDNIPITDKKYLNSFFTIKKGQKVLISGLLNTSVTNNLLTLPIIENLPILKDIFKYESSSKTTYNLSILIEAY